MRNMRKAAAVLLATGMVFALTACGGNKKVENTVNSIDDLEGKSIGVQLGTTGDIYASDYEGDKAGTKIERYNKGTDAVQALKQGKIDCVIIDSQPAEAFVEKNDDLQILDEPFADEEYAICISKDKPELTKEFNKALAELKKDGTLDSIADNYIGDDTKGKTPYESPKDIEYPNGKLVMATKNMEKADENLRYATLGFKEGVIATSNVLEAQTAWLSAQSEKIDAQIDVKLTEIYLKKSLGTLK